MSGSPRQAKFLSLLEGFCSVVSARCFVYAILQAVRDAVAHLAQVVATRNQAWQLGFEGA